MRSLFLIILVFFSGFFSGCKKNEAMHAAKEACTLLHREFPEEGLKDFYDTYKDNLGDQRFEQAFEKAMTGNCDLHDIVKFSAILAAKEMCDCTGQSQYWSCIEEEEEKYGELNKNLEWQRQVASAMLLFCEKEMENLEQ